MPNNGLQTDARSACAAEAWALGRATYLIPNTTLEVFESMTAGSGRVDFRLFSLGRSDSASESDFLSPQGTIILQRVGFPRDLDDCTCIPKGPVGFWGRALGPVAIEAQWYHPAQAIARSDIPADLSGSPAIKEYICHRRRPDPNVYPITSISVDDQEVQWVGFVKKRAVFRRLGHIVELDLSKLADEQTFTLGAEWDVDYIELRVTWLEGLGSEMHSSGWGIKEIRDLDTYRPPPTASVVQHTRRSEFEATLVPAALSRAVWSAVRERIRDTTPVGKPMRGVGTVRKAYKDEEDFFLTVLDIIEEVQRVLPKTRPHAFWNGNTPKDEPESGYTLRLLFEAICVYKNIVVVQEDPSRSGDVDFVFTGTSIGYEHLQVILEIKNAHSGRLERGLTHQLPKYLEEHQVKKGVYGVLWFKGRTFTEPADSSAADRLSRLNGIKPVAVSSIALFDVSFPVQASRLWCGFGHCVAWAEPGAAPDRGGITASQGSSSLVRRGVRPP
jgi:hypothetical protein